jgi:hypothetical protein
LRLTFDPASIDDYRTFLRVKSLPRYRIIGRSAEIPDEYAHLLGHPAGPADEAEYVPIPGLFDYQRDIAALAIRKRKFAAFIRCGLGKTLIELEWARHARSVLPADRSVLLFAPLMVVEQTIAEARRFYGDGLPIDQIAARDLPRWLESGSGIGITNYDSLRDDLPVGRLGAISCDESSIMKSHYGKWARCLLRLGAGLGWKLALTGTPAPNDRIEYANHAVFLDAFPSTNAFLARFFVNRGQTNERWELKPHALGPFYRALSDWCIFLNDPATYGWRDNVHAIPPIHVHVHDIDLDPASAAAVRGITGDLFVGDLGGIVSRGKLARIAKGGTSPKPAYIRSLVDSWPGESTIVWCKHNDEQDRLAALFPDAADIAGRTPMPRRRELVADFQAGRRRVLITKPDVLGFGMNFQVATHHVFSGVDDSYESFHQAVSRSNRVGSTRPLHVHIPVTEVERPMIDNVLRKAARVQVDTDEQERIFKDYAHATLIAG